MSDEHVGRLDNADIVPLVGWGGHSRLLLNDGFLVSL